MHRKGHIVKWMQNCVRDESKAWVVEERGANIFLGFVLLDEMQLFSGVLSKRFESLHTSRVPCPFSSHAWLLVCRLPKPLRTLTQHAIYDG